MRRKLRIFAALMCLLSGCAVLAMQAGGWGLHWSEALSANAASYAHMPSTGIGSTPTPACTPSWNIVDSPNPSTDGNHLSDVAAVSANDVWAVGSSEIGISSRSLALHWDGMQWSVVPTPDIGTADTGLGGVEALASNDVWAVGQIHDLSGPSLTLVEHWDGTQWSVVPSPNPVGGSSPVLYKVSALAPDYIWAVGSYSVAGWPRTLVEFWNGQVWSIVPSPNPGSQNNELWGVAAISPDDVWAVGCAMIRGVNQTLIEHWDGTQWSVVPSPNLSSDRDSQLFNVAAASSMDVWAVGTGGSGTHSPQNITMRWDGNLWRWSIVPSPNPGLADNVLHGVTALSSSDVWAVGKIGTYRDETLTEHWDGTQWTWIPSASPGGTYNSLEGVAAVSGEDVWTVGYYTNGFGPQYTLIEHYSNPCVTPSPTPTGTPPTLTPTRTRTPTPTGTRPTYTPTWTFVPTSTGFPTNTPTVTRTPIITPVGTVTPRPCEPDTNYVVTQSLGAQIVPGETDIGNHCDDCTTTVFLPFPFWFYGQTFTLAHVSSNGNVQFGSNDPSHNNVCLPFAPFNYAILPNWDELYTALPLTGIYTSVSGSAPNRIFNIEWQADMSPGGDHPAHFELRLYENSLERRFDIIYSEISRGRGTHATAGIQRDPNGAFVQYECNTAGTLTDTLQLTFSLAPCASPSDTPTPAATPTAQPILVGHVNWEARPSQPNQLQQLPITLTLKLGNTEVNYPTQLTDQYGFFTVTLGSLPNGTYTWRVDDAASAQHSPNYLAKSGVVGIGGAPITNMEMGVMRTGDANNDDWVSVSDFNILKVSFDSTCGSPIYDDRTDYTGDCFVNVSDFVPLKRNFGQEGAPPIGPR